MMIHCLREAVDLHHLGHGVENCLTDAGVAGAQAWKECDLRQYLVL